MKPYFLVTYNAVRFAFLKLKNRKMRVEGLQMVSWNGRILIGKNASVSFGDRFITDGRTVIIVDSDAELEIGRNVYFNENAMISCKKKILIGEGCKFGPNVCLFDNNHKFALDTGVSNEHSSVEIRIGDNCWIGANTVILKGSKIGKNCVIGAGCVISGEIPDASIVTMGRVLKVSKMK